MVAVLVLGLVVIDRMAGRIATVFVRPTPEDDLLVIAHRGDSRHAPENTRAAFSLAHERGAGAVECDVVFTADSVPVISHHHDLSNRVQSELRPAFIGRLNLGDVRRLDVGAWFSADYQGERIMTLAEALDFFRDRFRRVYLHDKHQDDIDDPSVERVQTMAQVILESGMADRIIVMVNSGDLQPWRKFASEITLMQAHSGPDGRARRIPLRVSFSEGLRFFFVYSSPRSLKAVGLVLAKIGLRRLGYLLGFWPDSATVRQYRNKGCAFRVFTVNDELRAKLYMRAGFEAIGTDDPGFLVELSKRLRIGARWDE